MNGSLRVAGLFAGIGGIELGLAQHGYESVLMSDVDDSAQTVLRAQFPSAEVIGDVRDLTDLPEVDLLTAGFPCQDLSQAGRKKGISGDRSSLVNEVFRLVDTPSAPQWILLENVSYMLRLDGGRAMNTLVVELEGLGYRWAYRVVDARSFGIPQRRQRVIFLASREHDPAQVLFADDAGAEVLATDAVETPDFTSAYGFYWTEGLRGLGWAHDAVPTIKGGSALGIPSAPAIWIPERDHFGTPTIRDAERLQGFDLDWTHSVNRADGRPGFRWRLVGNAVCVPMSEWVGWRLGNPGDIVSPSSAMSTSSRWPNAAYGSKGQRWAVEASVAPRAEPYSLQAFLKEELVPLSHRATSGFLSRADRSGLRFAPGFLDSLRRHQREMAA